MKKYIVVALCITLIACSKHPSKYAGTWQAEVSGFLTNSTVVLVLNKDGSTSTDASNSGGGLSVTGSWQVKEKKLLLSENNSEAANFDILGHSENEMILRYPDSGKIINFRRISK